MKNKLITCIALLCLLVSTAHSQVINTNTSPPTLEGPGMEFIEFLSQGSNWIIAPYGIYDSGSEQFGAGIGAFYQINNFVLAGMRLDGLGAEDGWDMWMPSGQIQLQAPLVLFGKVKLTPFGFTGIATPVTGQQGDNGTGVGVFGAGLAVGISKNFHLVGDIEKWVGAHFTGEQYRFGVAISF